MKKLITICFLIVITFALNAQSLSGTQTLPGIRGGALCYTVLNWKVNYQFIEKDGAFYLSISNPSVSVANNSLYGSYSKSDLGLSVWPDSDPKPYNFSIEVTITYPGGTQTTRTYNLSNFTGVYIGHLHENKFKNLSISSFKVTSAGSMNYNGGRDGVVDKLIEDKKNASNKTNGTQSNGSNNSQGSSTNSTTSTSPKITNTQQKINPNDPNPMTNGTSGNYQAPKSSSSNSNKQLSVEEQQSIQQGITAGTELISDGVAVILDVLDVKKQRRESQYYSETDKVFAIGYSFSTSSWLGIDVSMFNPELGKLGWGVTLRFNPSIFWSDFNVGLYGDYRDYGLYDDLHADDYSYLLLETGKKISFNIGGSLNIGLSSWLFVQIGGGIGSVSTYSKYEITNANSSFQKDNIGDKFYTRKDEDRIMGFCNENNLVLRFTNVLCLKTGFATYNFKSPEFTFGILFMPSQ